MMDTFAIWPVDPGYQKLGIVKELLARVATHYGPCAARLVGLQDRDRLLPATLAGRPIENGWCLLRKLEVAENNGVYLTE
jgi:hypothetical protein